MPGLAGYWPSRSVTFIDNHDTGKDCPATLAAVSVWLLAICSLLTKTQVEQDLNVNVLIGFDMTDVSAARVLFMPVNILAPVSSDT